MMQNTAKISYTNFRVTIVYNHAVSKYCEMKWTYSLMNKILI
jgi:hypothetical protein